MTRPKSRPNRLERGYDRAMAPLERLGLRGLRRQLIALAQGRILEIGIGTGATLPFYPGGGCVVGIDENAEMLLASAARARTQSMSVHLSRAAGERLPFRDQAFDAVVGTLVLCSVADPAQALHEIRRVLRSPGGQLLLLEHTRPNSPLLGRLIDLANRPWYAWNGQCNLNRRTADLVTEAGFRMERVQNHLGGLLRIIMARND